MKVKVTKKRVSIEATILNTLEAYLIVNREFIPEKDAENLVCAIEYQRQRTPTNVCPL